MPAYTWTTGETISATKLNTLETEAWRVANLIASGSSTSTSTTTSTSFVDAAASVTFTALATTAYIQVSGGGIHNNNGAVNSATTVGININGADYTVCHCSSSANGSQPPFCGGVLVSGLTVNTSYTAKLRIKTNNALYTAAVNNNPVVTSSQQISVWSITK